jgi:anti-sigma-K factor RskA
MNYLLPERLDRLAREYALGTLAGRARRRFERVLQGSPAATMAVQTWQQRLAVLDGATVPMAPPLTNWRAIEKRLFAPAGRPAAAPRGLGAWLGGVLSGRTLAGALAGALACVVFLRLQPGVAGLEPRGDTLPASYVGLLLDAGGTPTLVASSRRQGRVLTVKLLQPIAIPAGRVAELWALPKGGAPFPVGTLPAQGNARIELPDTSEKLFANVQDLGVSLEPAPAQAGATPAAFVLTGHCVKVW